MALSAPVRTGILGKLSRGMPAVDAKGVFRPTALILKVTSTCNAKCRMCSEEKERNAFDRFSVEEASSIIEQASAVMPPRSRKVFNLMGGEPFLNVDFVGDMAAKAEGAGFKIFSSATNGFWGKDVGTARKILQAVSGRLKNTKLLLELSCDSFHNSQEHLKVEYVAEIMHLIDVEYPNAVYAINGMQMGDLEALKSLLIAFAGRSKGRKVRTVRGADRLSIVIDDKYGQRARPLILAHPLLHGAYSEKDRSLFFSKPLEPSYLARISGLLNPQLYIGVDRQFYIHLFLGSLKILPMGSVNECSIPQLVRRVEMDPVAVSLLRHSYKKIYPRIKRIFPGFDNWIRQFYSPYNPLFGLEADEPVLV